MSISTLFKSITGSVSSACNTLDVGLNGINAGLTILSDKIESTKRNHAETVKRRLRKHRSLF